MTATPHAHPAPTTLDATPPSPDAAHFARALLNSLGQPDPVRGAGDHPALAWHRAGLADVTGHPAGPPLIGPTALASAADGYLLALKALTDDPAALPPNGALLLGERARLLGLRRGGRVSPNGACHLLDAADGRVALNLPRPDDWTLLPALFDGPAPTDWAGVASEVATRPVAALIARGAEIGLAIAADRHATATQWCLRAPGGAVRRGDRPRVLDLSALWAGPLAASLLAMLGADVAKLEHVTRPDGARFGHPGFHALLNDGKHPLRLDFQRDRARLAALVRHADIVIEGSRPRALAALGLDAAAEVARGAVWVSITGHGRAAPERIGFGDDCAVAGGIASAMAAAHGEPLMAGDAIADPLSGLAAALAAWATWRSGTGALIDIALCRAVSHAIAAPAVPDTARWPAMIAADGATRYPLRTPPPARSADAARHWPC